MRLSMMHVIKTEIRPTIRMQLLQALLVVALAVSSAKSSCAAAKNIERAKAGQIPITRQQDMQFNFEALSARGGASEAEPLPEEEGDVVETEGVEDPVTPPETNSTSAEKAEEDVSNVDTQAEDVVTSEPTKEIVQDADAVRENAIQLRLKGKELHDEGDFVQAAAIFQQAADSLLAVLENDLEGNSGGNNKFVDDYATCRLHEALCYLKGEKYEECIEACTNFLQDGDDSTQSHCLATAPAVRARAFHRRAKAKLRLGDPAGALVDARSAAFLGDRKAVALYGRLMRGSSSSSLSSLGTLEDGSSPLAKLLSSTSGPSSDSASLFDSLLSKSDASNGRSTSLLGDLSPAAMLLGRNPLQGGKKGDGLAKSVLQSLSKRLEDESTQDTICKYLQGANKAQLEQLAAMAGASGMVSEEHIDKVVDFCHNVTPKTIQKTVRRTKGVVYVVQVFRRIAKVLDKYKSVIAALILLQWTKSAMFRPMPTNRRAAKRALRDAMKASRAAKK